MEKARYYYSSPIGILRLEETEGMLSALQLEYPFLGDRKLLETWWYSNKKAEGFFARAPAQAVPFFWGEKTVRDGDWQVQEIERLLQDGNQLCQDETPLCQETPLLRETNRQLQEYFQGKRKEFDIPLYRQGTEFQQKVWKVLRQIPYGETRSYGEIAEMVGNPRASRAVGGANNRNPVLIIVPCHRVIGANGALVGFGGGLGAKEFLLDLEKSV